MPDDLTEREAALVLTTLRWRADAIVADSMAGIPTDVEADPEAAVYALMLMRREEPANAAHIRRVMDALVAIAAGMVTISNDLLAAGREKQAALEARAERAEAAVGRFALAAERSEPGATGAGPVPAARSEIEPADLDVHALATALGCSLRTVERAIAAGRFVGEAVPIVIGGLDRKRFRWRQSQLPAVRAIFAPPPAPVSPPLTPPLPARSTGRPRTKKKRQKVVQAERKDILARLRDGD